MKLLYRLGMLPFAPRWLKIWCLKMILKYVAVKLNKRIQKLSDEQKLKLGQFKP